LGDRPVIRVVDGPDRLAGGREVARRVARAAPEQAAGAAGAAGGQVALPALRARDRERQRGRRLRPGLEDVLAVRVARAAGERAEPAAPRHQHAAVRLSALGTGIPGPRDGRQLLARQRSRFLVLRVERAGEEPAVAAEPDDHGVPERADLVGRLGREVLALEFAPLLVDELLERSV